MACVRRIIRTQDACALPRGVCVRPLSAEASKRTRAIGESRSGPCGDMQKGADLDKNRPSNGGVLHLHGQLGTKLKGFIVVSCSLFCIGL